MMMKVYKQFFRVALLTIVFSNGVESVQAQSGDQMLDGIGETGMVARYVFNGDIRDWSRNNLHGNYHGGEAKFVTDKRFGKVLSLSGEEASFVSVPTQAMSNLESISITGWVNLLSDRVGQHFFDFGKDAQKHFYAAPRGTQDLARFQAYLGSRTGKHGATVSAVIETNKWVHLTIVVDIPSKSMKSYVDGQQVSESHEIPKELTEVFGQVGSGSANQLYIGKSLTPEDPLLHALLHDFRIYRIPLTASQVGGIYNNSHRGIGQRTVNVGKPQEELQSFTLTQSQLYNAYLTKVDDVEVGTNMGELPRLPSFVEGTYKEGLVGPKVRVLWPSPTDNHTVLEAGRYTVTGSVPGTDLKPKAIVTVKGNMKSTGPQRALEAFDLSQVTLSLDAGNRETKFIENRDKFITTLDKTDPNSFLYMFRNAFGQPQPSGAEPLGVWDSQETKLRGHATGHYLTAIAQAYASTSYDAVLQANFKNKMEYMVNTLYDLARLSGRSKVGEQMHVADPTAVPFGPGKSDYDSDLSAEGIRTDYWNWGVGYISAYPPDQFIMLENGAKYGGQNNQVWAPYYTLHKILAGLIDVYEVSGNQKALDVAVGMSDWVYARLNKLPKETLIMIWNTYIAGEFGGMNETMAHLYRITNNENYLKTAQLFDNIDMFFGDAQHSHGLAKNVDTFRGLHANQHIPQIVGSIEMYNVSKDTEYYKVADNFWHKAVNDYMYSIGGVAGARNPANAEVFTAEPATLYKNGFSADGQNETCATYNMLKLTGNLFMFDQNAAYMDYYERGLYNHILASVAEHSPANTYHVPLRAGAIKQFGNPDMSGFTCCNGTAIESSTKLQNTIYYKGKDNEALYVNLYIPSTLDWKERGILVKQVTSFPKEDQTRLIIEGNGKFDVMVRVPSWATKGFFVEINGKKQNVNAEPGTYLKLSRTWKNGDTISLRMPFEFHLDPVMDQQNIASLFYGPILLAAQEPEARKDWRKVTFDADDIGRAISGHPDQLQFTIDGVTYKPFYETYGRHSVYLDVTLR